jgi:lipopolysaccharide transport system ATP-binding protein
MSSVIQTFGLGKAYKVAPREAYGALRDTLVRAATAPVRLLKSIGQRPAAPVDGTFWALRDVSFDVQEGQIIGLVGKNGSGKSTLLKILSRITEPTAGEALIRGRVGSLLEVGTGFHPELTGRENVFVNGAILGMKRAEIAAKFDEIVAFADIDRFIDTPVKHYSSGMQMRLAFAVAAHLEPEILLVDEVLAVGDLAFQKKCLGKMDDVSRAGRTVLFVSHQMNQLRRLCSRCLWLDGGRLKQVGSTAEVINRYEASHADLTTTLEAEPSSRGASFLTWTMGEPGSTVHTLQDFGPVTVRFLLRVDKPIRNGHHGITLSDRDAFVLWGAGTDNLDLAPGIHEIVYSFDSLPLRPGPYRWHVSIFDADRFINNLDCIPELSVETVPTGHRRDEYAGVMNLPFGVEITPKAQPAAAGPPKIRLAVSR